MLKTIYFDLGNVLIFFSLPKMILQISHCTGLSPLFIQTFFFETDLREQYEKGKISTDQLYHLFSQEAPRPFSQADFKTAFADIFTPNTQLWPIVERLKQQNVKLILLSNTSECHYQYANTHYPILKLFDHKILSFELGAWKPDQHIFKTALSYAHCEPAECLYFDDIPEFIASAAQAGLPGEVFTDVSTLKSHLQLRGCTI